MHTPEEYRDTIGSMLEEVTRLTEMVDGLLSISRADAGQVVLHKTTFSPLELTREVVALLGLLAEEKAQQIRIEGDANLSVYADRLVLHRGLANIVENAIKYGPAASRISIRVVRSEDLREKIFERFFRIDASRSRQAGGSGLGLAIAKWAIEVNGGSVTLHPGLQGGNLFLIRMPALNSGH